MRRAPESVAEGCPGGSTTGREKTNVRYAMWKRVPWLVKSNRQWSSLWSYQIDFQLPDVGFSVILFEISYIQVHMRIRVNVYMFVHYFQALLIQNPSNG